MLYYFDKDLFTCQQDELRDYICGTRPQHLDAKASITLLKYQATESWFLDFRHVRAWPRSMVGKYFFSIVCDYHAHVQLPYLLWYAVGQFGFWVVYGPSVDLSDYTICTLTTVAPHHPHPPLWSSTSEIVHHGMPRSIDSNHTIIDGCKRWVEQPRDTLSSMPTGQLPRRIDRDPSQPLPRLKGGSMSR